MYFLNSFSSVSLANFSLSMFNLITLFSCRFSVSKFFFAYFFFVSSLFFSFWALKFSTTGINMNKYYKILFTFFINIFLELQPDSFLFSHEFLNYFFGSIFFFDHFGDDSSLFFHFIFLFCFQCSN